jgi:hypothetical protein
LGLKVTVKLTHSNEDIFGASMSKGIRLKAIGPEDLTTISACLQDAVIKVGDIAFIPKLFRFAFVGNRFCWENNSFNKIGKRSRCAGRFENVLKTRSLNLPTNLTDHVLNLLSIHQEVNENGTATITLLFSGNASIQLDVECIEMYLEDISEPWLTKNTPQHDSEDRKIGDESFET